MSGEVGGGSASPESGSRALMRRRVRCSRRPEKRMWPARGWFSGSGALGKIGDLLQALLAVWEKDVAGKVACGECFLMMIRPIGKRFLTTIRPTGKLWGLGGEGDRNETRSQEGFLELMTRGNWKELGFLPWL